MTRPTITVEVALQTEPTEAPVWADVTAYVRGAIDIRRGRQRELDRMEAGTLALALDNRDRRFDPLYEDGPYYGLLLPMRRIRVRCETQDPRGPGYYVPFGLFCGYIEAWTPRYEARDAWVEVQASDGFKVLAMTRLNGDWPSQDTGARIDAVLSAVGWTTGESWVLDSAVNGLLGDTTVLGPVGDRIIMDGQTKVIATTLEDAPALGHIQEMAQLETGVFFIDYDGEARFYNRFRTIRYGTQLYNVFNNDGPPDRTAPFSEIEIEYDDALIYNEVRIARQDGDEQVATDTASQVSYFVRTLQWSGLPLITDDDAFQLAHYLLGRYKQPAPRVSRLGLRAPLSAIAWYILLCNDLGDDIFIYWQPPGGGDPIYFGRSLLQGISHRIDQERWEIQLWLAPHDPNRYWWLDYPMGSNLGTTTRLAL